MFCTSLTGRATQRAAARSGSGRAAALGSTQADEHRVARASMCWSSGKEFTRLVVLDLGVEAGHPAWVAGGYRVVDAPDDEVQAQLGGSC